MKKKTIITTETREVWVIQQPSWAVEEIAPLDSEIQAPSESLTLHIDHDAKKDTESSESTTPDVQE